MAWMYSDLTIAPSIQGNVQATHIAADAVPVISITAAVQSVFVTAGLTVEIDNQQPRDWPYSYETISNWRVDIQDYNTGSIPAGISLPALQFSATGDTSAEGILAIVLPMLLATDWQASDAPQGVLSITLPSLRVDFSGVEGLYGILNATLPGLSLDGTILRGAVGTLDITLPMIGWESSGIVSAEGILDITIPALEFAARYLPLTDTVAGEDYEQYQNLVMNLRNFGLTKYKSYGFNSFCRFAGKNLGMNGTALYDLDSGDNDDGQLLEWNFKIPYIDLEQKIKHRMTEAWFSYKSNGDLIVTVVAPDGSEYEYPLDSVDTTEDGLRVKFGKGIRSKYVALDVRNVDGSTITLDNVRLHFHKFMKER